MTFFTLSAEQATNIVRETSETADTEDTIIMIGLLVIVIAALALIKFVGLFKTLWGMFAVIGLFTLLIGAPELALALIAFSAILALIWVIRGKSPKVSALRECKKIRKNIKNIKKLYNVTSKSIEKINNSVNLVAEKVDDDDWDAYMSDEVDSANECLQSLFTSCEELSGDLVDSDLEVFIDNYKQFNKLLKNILKYKAKKKKD